MPIFTSTVIETPVTNTQKSNNHGLLDVVEIVSLWAMVATTILLVSTTWIY